MTEARPARIRKPPQPFDEGVSSGTLTNLVGEETPDDPRQPTKPPPPTPPPRPMLGGGNVGEEKMSWICRNSFKGQIQHGDKMAYPLTYGMHCKYCEHHILELAPLVMMDLRILQGSWLYVNSYCMCARGMNTWDMDELAPHHIYPSLGGWSLECRRKKKHRYNLYGIENRLRAGIIKVRIVYIRGTTNLLLVKFLLSLVAQH